MSRRYLLAWVLLASIVPATQAQLPFARELIPSRTALGRVGLEKHWYGVIPLGGLNERVIQISLDDDMFFAQTNLANLFAFDAESGRLLWGVRLGNPTGEAQPVSLNSTTVFATNGGTLIGLERETGHEAWSSSLDSYSLSATGANRGMDTSFATSATAANDERVVVGLSSGKVVGFHLQEHSTERHLGARPGRFAFAWQSNKPITSRPILTEKVLAFGSNDGKVYVARLDPPTLMMRFLTGGPISAPLGTYGIRTLLIPSHDNNVYAVDLYSGHTFWTFASQAPVMQQPLTADQDVFVMNSQGVLSCLDVKTGELRWAQPTGAGNPLAIGPKRVYLRSSFLDLMIADRSTGQIVIGPHETRDEAGVDLRSYDLALVNDQNDRLYFATPSGFLLCIRELGSDQPHPLRDPKAHPFGYLSPQGPAVAPSFTEGSDN